MNSIITNKNVMNKTIKFLKIIMVLIASVAITSCVQDDDYTVPNSLGEEENEGLQTILTGLDNNTLIPISIGELKDIYTTYENAQTGFDYDKFLQITSNIVVKGYVSSSDETGNFYKEFYIQDSPENPTAAIGVILNQADSYNQFNKGREVYIRLMDMYIGQTSSDIIAIGGKPNDDEVGQFTGNQIPQQLFRSNVTEAITALELNMTDINSSHIGMFVKINNTEFPTNLQGQPYGDSSEDFDTQRTVQACEGFEYSNFILETSSFANFYNVPLPTQNGGSISGIITQSFGGDDLVMALNSLNDVQFTNERCSLLNIEDFTNIFEEDFEGMTNNSAVSGNGWTNYAEEGGFTWRVTTSSDNQNSGSKIASMGAFNSNDNVNIAWLITPAINFDTLSNELLSFRSSNSFSDNSELELLISTDWDGTEAGVTTANWSSLPGNIVGDNEFYQNWVSSGSIDLSGYSGMGYVAFKYIGGDNSNNEDGTYEIDNFTVLGL
tara:strand:- start:6340 stop:7824 length:1485 start_codon:yes stop_codon:yes gene_type:complete